MSKLYHAYCRAFQFAFRLGMPLLPWRRPEILKDGGELLARIKAAGLSKVLLVTDSQLTALGLYGALQKTLTEGGVAVTVYDGTQANPTIDNIEAAYALYKEQGCEGLIAFGGGSPMDCAKAVGARVVHPKKSIQKMRGVFKVLHRLPFLAAAPTTAGTGSETTVAAVVVDSKTGEKYAMNDISLVPRWALLDPKLTAGLPRAVTAQTGLDALTHAVEAYIGQSNTRQTRQNALQAVSLIFGNLRLVCEAGGDLQARRNMQQAAFLAGAAFTRAYVGNIHAIAHTLGGLYGTPHGLANAVILPYVLEDYGKAIEKPMAELAFKAGAGDEKRTRAENAAAFLRAVKLLCKDLDIPQKIPALKEADIPLLAKRALHEANPLYPVPVIYDAPDMERIYRKLLV